MDLEKAYSRYVKDGNTILWVWTESLKGNFILGGPLAYCPLSFCAERTGIPIPIVTNETLEGYELILLSDFDRFRRQNPGFINTAESTINKIHTQVQLSEEYFAQIQVGFLFTLDLLQLQHLKDTQVVN